MTEGLRWPGAAFAACFCMLVAVCAMAQDRNGAMTKDMPLRLALTPDWHDPQQPFEGWGTALAWFANVTGGMPDPVRSALADLLYGRDGLGFTIARYNIGGGNAPETGPYLRPGAAVPGFWRRPEGATGKDWWQPDNPDHWDWSADANQRWWLDAIRDRVAPDDVIFEAFSNSPPYFMTVSGLVSGAESGLEDNLRPGQETAFAHYLARVVEELGKRHGIRFRTLSPVNEPNTPYWFSENRQEGSHWSPAAQARMIRATDMALRARGLPAVVAAMDETNAQTFVTNWIGYDDATRAAISQLNVHSYSNDGQTAVRDIARTTGKRLWMSEVDLSPANFPQDFTDIRPALALAEHIIGDLKRLEPVAWVFWQAVEDMSPEQKLDANWGLIKMDLSARAPADHPFHITRKYWAMRQFSAHVRPGDRLLRVDDHDSIAALQADGQGFVLIHVNHAPIPRLLEVTLPPWAAQVLETHLFVTDAEREAKADDGAILPAPDGRLHIHAAPMSISTAVVRFRPE